MAVQLIADSGATKCEWCLVNSQKKKTFFTTGISLYFLNSQQTIDLLQKELMPELGNEQLNEVHFYGTGLGNPENAAIIYSALKKLFSAAEVTVETDLLAAARALFGNKKGIACILGTGSNSCYYDGESIIKNTLSLGYVLGDEGSGADLGKKVLQHHLYKIFDEDLRSRFDAMFVTTPLEILETLYKKPFPNRYLAGFAIFLSHNRGHCMVENIIGNCLNDFFLNQLHKYPESLAQPVSFVGSIAFAFKDILQELCNRSAYKLGQVLKSPMEGLVKYHSVVT